MAMSVDEPSLASVGEPSAFALVDDTYYIGTAQELWDIMQDSSILNDSSVKIELTANINLDDLGNVDGNGSNWIAVGDIDNHFQGTFNGNGYTISNLTINKPDADYQGFFGYTNGAIIQNVKLENVQVEGKDRTGSLVGFGEYGIIENSYSTGDVTGNSNVGGLVGWYDLATIKNSYSTADVSGNNTVGGLAGCLCARTDNCYATGDVVGVDNVGGLTGNNFGGDIANSYATGSVSGSFTIGGLVGTNGGPLSNSYATGTVSGTEKVGGLAGYNYYDISNSFATGTVTGTGSNVGGLIGGEPYSMSIVNSYFTSNSPDNGKGEAKEESWFTPENIATATGITVHAGFMGNLIFQIGTDGSSLSKIEVDTTLNLGTLNFDVSTESSARNTITKCDELLETLNKKSADIGVNVNILNSIYEGNSLTQINLSASNSRIIDADIAEESSNLVKSQILQNATATLLSQTQNMTGNLLLGLLRM